MIRRPPRSTHCISSAASDVYKRQGEWPRSSTTEHRTLTLCAERPSNKGSTRQASKPSAITNSNTSATIERGTSPTNRHATRQRGQLPPQHQNQGGGREDRGHVADTRSHDQAGPQGKSPQTCGGRQTTSGTTTRIGTLHSATTATHHSSIVHHQGCLLYTSPSPRDQRGSRMPSSA